MAVNLDSKASKRTSILQGMADAIRNNNVEAFNSGFDSLATSSIPNNSSAVGHQLRRLSQSARFSGVPPSTKILAAANTAK